MPRGVYKRKPHEPGLTRNFPDPITPRPAPPPPVPIMGAIRVVLVKKRALGTMPEEREISWPPSWRLPERGEGIVFESGWSGFIEYVAFDLDQNVIKVNLR